MLKSSSIYWQLRTTVRRNGCSGKECLEIPLVDLGKTFESPYCAVSVSTSGYKPTWDYGGNIWASYPLLGKNSLITQQKLRVNSYHVIKIPQLFDGKYRLHYKAPKWFPDFTIKVWEYRGEIPQNEPVNVDFSSVEALLAQTLDSVAALDSKINQLQVEVTDQDAGIYTLAQGLGRLLPNYQASQLEQNTARRLNFDRRLL